MLVTKNVQYIHLLGTSNCFIIVSRPRAGYICIYLCIFPRSQAGVWIHEFDTSTSVYYIKISADYAIHVFDKSTKMCFLSQQSWLRILICTFNYSLFVKFNQFPTCIIAIIMISYPCEIPAQEASALFVDSSSY